MKFTKEDAFEKLKGFLTNNGKKTLRMSEQSINKQLETLIPLVASEEMELDDFIGKVKDTFSVMNSNVEKDTSDFVKEWDKSHPVDDSKPNEPNPNTKEPDDATAELLKRLEDLEKKEMERTKEAALSQKKIDLLKAMKEKGIKDEQWAKDFVSEVTIDENMDVDAKAEAFLKIYNRSRAGYSTTTPLGNSSGSEGSGADKDPLADVRKMMQQQREVRESLTNKKD